MNDKVNTPLAEFGEKLLKVLDRIATALEGKVIAKHAPPQTIEHTTSTAQETRTAPAELLPNNAASAAPSPAPSIPYDTVRKAILAYQDAKGQHAASDVLKRFGAKYIMDLKQKPEQYQAVLDSLK